MIWLCIGIALCGIWLGNTLTAALYVIGYVANEFKTMDTLADNMRYISALLAVIFISIGIAVIK